MGRLLIFLIISIFFIGCVIEKDSSYYNKVASSSTKEFNYEHIYKNLNSVIADISRQLKLSQNQNSLDNKIVVTSFVDLDNFSKTTPFGKILAESMINDLYMYQFHPIDFRGRDNLLVNENGEFYITRKTQELKDEIETADILVGTYSKFDLNSTVINVRILDFENGEVLASARVIYVNQNNDCSLFNNCNKPAPKKIHYTKILEDK